MYTMHSMHIDLLYCTYQEVGLDDAFVKALKAYRNPRISKWEPRYKRQSFLDTCILIPIVRIKKSFKLM